MAKASEAFSVTVDYGKLDKELQAVAREIERLPASPGSNPLARALKFYQNTIRRKRPPKVSETGNWFGNTWPAHAPQYTRKTDNVTVPAWGGVPKLHGRGKVKGRLRGGSRNVRLRASSKQMKDTGRLLQGWITVKPRFGLNYLSAVIQSPLEYARKVSEDRNFYWSGWLKWTLEQALQTEMSAYLRRILDKRLKGAR